MDPLQYVYLLQEREFVNNKKQVYKIGKTKQPNLLRFNSYPKGSVLIQQFYCNDCDEIETQIITLFNTKYKLRKGREYFEGNFKEMIFDIYKIINIEKEIENDKIKEKVRETVENIITNILSNSEKEDENTVIKKEESIKMKYTCNFCNFNTNNKTNFDKHNLTPNHLKNKENNKTVEQINAELIYECPNCNKKYKSNVGLWKHKKVCNKYFL